MQWWTEVLMVMSLAVTGAVLWWSVRLHQSKLQAVQSLGAVLQGSGDAIFIEDSHGSITHWSPGAEAMFGYRAEEMLGQSRLSLIPADQVELDGQAVSQIDARTVSLVTSRIGKSGDTLPVAVSYTPIRDADGRLGGLCCVMRDTQVQAVADELIRAMSFNDALTGLPNWRLLRDRLWRAQINSGRQKSYFAVLYVDLDDFKSVNALHGEEGGNELLKEVAARLMAAVRQKDTVARLVGDEFVILLEELGSEEAHARNHANAVADKVLDLMEARDFMLGNATVACSASIGILVVQGGNGFVDDLVKKADAAMMQVKKGRRMVAESGFMGKAPSNLP